MSYVIGSQTVLFKLNYIYVHRCLWKSCMHHMFTCTNSIFCVVSCLYAACGITYVSMFLICFFSIVK